jgi:hypothetical protein
MLTPERRAFLQAAYSTLLRPSVPAEDQPPASDPRAEHAKPKEDNDSSEREERAADAPPE